MKILKKLEKQEILSIIQRYLQMFKEAYPHWSMSTVHENWKLQMNYEL